MKVKLEKKSLSFIDVLLIAFIILKLVGVINWSWLLILLPLWIELVVAGVVYACFYVKYRRYLK